MTLPEAVKQGFVSKETIQDNQYPGVVSWGKKIGKPDFFHISFGVKHPPRDNPYVRRIYIRWEKWSEVKNAFKEAKRMF